MIDERSNAALIEENGRSCKHCGKTFLRERSMLTHEANCAEDIEATSVTSELWDHDPPFYVTPPRANPTVYHISPHCYQLPEDVEVVERDEAYIEWNELKPCSGCTNP